MSATQRGLIIFVILVVASAIFCVYLPFFGLPRAGFGVGLPVISLPAEILAGNVLPATFGYDFPNTFTSLIVVDIIVLLIGFTVNRAVSGKAPDQFVPRGLTNFIEMIVEFWYNTARNAVGNFTGHVLPLALTIFTFLLVANMIKLIPGNETVGIISCAEPGQLGYPLQGNGPFLRVDGGSLGARAGSKVTADDTHACEEKYPQFTPPIVAARAARGVTQPGGGEHAPAEGTAPATAPATQHSNSVDSLMSYTNGDPNNKSTAARVGNPELFTVIPYFRPLTTDLNLTLALAIITVITVQIWGIQALGIPYFFKFVNIPALGNISKNPMGGMDFVVGLIEIVSELSRLVSLSFRLLGSMFAGGILLAVMSFLVAGLLPVVFYFLELFFGLIQAYVFAILTVMYASQAVTAHHADEHEEHAEAHGEHAGSHA